MHSNRAMNDKTTTEAATKIGQQETGSYYYLQLFLYRAAEKSNGATTKNLNQFVPWFKEREARVEYCQLGEIETEAAIDSAKGSGMDVLDSIAKTLSTAEDDEEVWMEVEYFRDHKHCEEVYSKMMQDKSIEPGNEFFGLVTQGKRLITGGFSPLRE
jgi:uncharacterized protein YbaA (DUF1428 family)